MGAYSGPFYAAFGLVLVGGVLFVSVLLGFWWSD